jgi:hypothetical protein
MLHYLAFKRNLVLLATGVLLIGVMLPLVTFAQRPKLPPTLTLSPTSGSPGMVVLATGSAWVPGRPITLFFDKTLLGTFTPQSSTWQYSFRVPLSAIRGGHTVMFETKAAGGSLTTRNRFTVVLTPVCMESAPLNDQIGPWRTLPCVLGKGA